MNEKTMKLQYIKVSTIMSDLKNTLEKYRSYKDFNECRKEENYYSYYC